MSTGLSWRGAYAFAVVIAALTSAASADDKNNWIDISAPVTDQLVKDGKKIGYPGLTAGVTVDPATGDVYMVVCDNGLWKSTDHGKTFARIDGGKIGGRTETGYALSWDPAGKRLACFMIYGACASTDDAGKTWNPWKANHMDYGMVDWHDTGKTMLAVRHEAGGVLCMTTDGGQTWNNLSKVADTKGNKHYTALGMFDAKALMGSRGEGLFRSTDAGQSWKPVALQESVKLVAPIMTLHQSVGYWCTEKGIIASKDKGETWTPWSDVKAAFGPHFGKDDSHIVVVTKDGFQESTDAGKTWKLAAPLPKGFNVGLVGPNYAWDVKANIFYASSMGKATYKFER
jgi:photosystem II stability/assembly factor-like uncharacterized protein